MFSLVPHLLSVACNVDISFFVVTLVVCPSRTLSLQLTLSLKLSDTLGMMLYGDSGGAVEDKGDAKSPNRKASCQTRGATSRNSSLEGQEQRPLKLIGAAAVLS